MSNRKQIQMLTFRKATTNHRSHLIITGKLKQFDFSASYAFLWRYKMYNWRAEGKHVGRDNTPSSWCHHVPTIGEMILDGLFPRPLKTLLPEVWLKAVPHERSCSWGRCVYLEPGKLIEVFTKIPGLFLPTAHFFILVDSGGFKHP